MPSRRAVISAIAVLAVVAVLAGLAAFANTALGYVPVLSVVVLLVLGRVYLAILKRSITFTEQGPSSGSVRGDMLEFALAVENHSVLPATRIEALFEMSNSTGEGIRADKRYISLPPRCEKVFDLGVRFDHIGFFQVGISQIELYDPFGVFLTRRESKTLHTVNILPRVVDIAGFDLSEKSLQESTKNIKTFINDGMDYSSVREYRWGDPMKSIHWKLSSKAMGDYFTRLYETPSTPGIAIFIDFESDVSDTESLMVLYDALVESALSIERYATRSGFDTRLLFIDGRGESRNLAGPLGERHEELMRVFPRMSKGDGQLTVELIRRVSASSNCPSNLVVCSANVTEGLANALAAIAGPMRMPYLVAAYAEDDERPQLARQLRRFEQARIPTSLIRNASELASGGM